MWKGRPASSVTNVAAVKGWRQPVQRKHSGCSCRPSAVTRRPTMGSPHCPQVGPEDTSAGGMDCGRCVGAVAAAAGGGGGGGVAGEVGGPRGRGVAHVPLAASCKGKVCG